MLLAIAGGVHLAVYAEHASLRIEYSIFLCSQADSLWCSIYFDIDWTGCKRVCPSIPPKESGVNLFGLVGTGILIGLYVLRYLATPAFSKRPGRKHWVV